MLIPAGGGRPLRAGPTRPIVKIGPHLDSRLLGVMESELPPGGGFPLHTHEEYEEAFYVLDGEIEYCLDGTWTRATPGTTVFVPVRGVHGFRNVTDQPARHLAITSPATAMTMVEGLMNGGPDQWPGVLQRYASRLETSPPV